MDTVKGPDQAIAVTEAIAKLPLKLKEVILLYYYQNMQLDEIALALGDSCLFHFRTIETRQKQIAHRIERRDLG